MLRFTLCIYKSLQLLEHFVFHIHCRALTLDPLGTSVLQVPSSLGHSLGVHNFYDTPSPLLVQ